MSEGNENLKSDVQYSFSKQWVQDGLSYDFQGSSSAGLFSQWQAELIMTLNNPPIVLTSTCSLSFLLTESGEGDVDGILQANMCVPVPSDINVCCPVSGKVWLINNEEKQQLHFETKMVGLLEGDISIPGTKNVVPLLNSMHTGQDIPYAIDCDLIKHDGVFKKDLNKWGDCLPIIPHKRETENEIIRYRQYMILTLTKEDGKPLDDYAVRIISSNGNDIMLDTKTMQYTLGNFISDSGGRINFAVESCGPGTSILRVDSDKINVKPFNINFKEAWYELEFQITRYYIPVEQEFGAGDLIEVKGLEGKYNREFIKKVRMQGTGNASGPGRPYPYYIAVIVGTGKTAETSEYYVKKKEEVMRASSGNVKKGETIATDPRIIPKRKTVTWEAGLKEKKRIFTCTSNDTGQAVQGYHIDLYLGEGNENLNSINDLGTNLKDVNGKKHYFAKVKYLGN